MAVKRVNATKAELLADPEVLEASTLTDALVILGHLCPDALLDGVGLTVDSHGNLILTNIA